MLVSGAAAEITFYRVTNLRFGRIALAIQEIRRRHHHAGRAVAALQSMLLPESLLQRMIGSVARQAFDGRDGRAVGLRGEYRARLDRLAIHEHRAGSAKRAFTADVRTGQSHDLADVMDEEHSRFDHVRAGLAINRYVYAHRYFRLRLPLRPWVTQKSGFRTRSLRRCRYSRYGEAKTNRPISIRGHTGLSLQGVRKLIVELFEQHLRVFEVGGIEAFVKTETSRPKNHRRQPQTD